MFIYTMWQKLIITVSHQCLLYAAACIFLAYLKTWRYVCLTFLYTSRLLFFYLFQIPLGSDSVNFIYVSKWSFSKRFMKMSVTQADQGNH